MNRESIATKIEGDESVKLEKKYSWILKYREVVQFCDYVEHFINACHCFHMVFSYEFQFFIYYMATQNVTLKRLRRLKSARHITLRESQS